MATWGSNRGASESEPFTLTLDQNGNSFLLFTFDPSGVITREKFEIPRKALSLPYFSGTSYSGCPLIDSTTSQYQLPEEHVY